MAIAGFVLGIVAIVFSFIPVLGAFITFPCSLIGLPLAAVAFFRNRSRNQGNGMAIAGIVVCIAAPVIAVVMTIAVFSTVDDIVEDLEKDGLQSMSEGLANDRGREYMLAQPCSDVMAEYASMSIAGHDTAITHVANVYNIKTETNPYIAVSDAKARIDQCN